MHVGGFATEPPWKLLFDDVGSRLFYEYISDGGRSRLHADGVDRRRPLKRVVGFSLESFSPKDETEWCARFKREGFNSLADGGHVSELWSTQRVDVHSLGAGQALTQHARRADDGYHRLPRQSGML